MINFNKKIQEQFAKMCATGKLFRMALTGQQVWDIYINSFTNESDPQFRDPTSTVHTCNHCNNFLRRYGNVVAVDENFGIITMFDFEDQEGFENVSSSLSAALRASIIADVFFETLTELNTLPYEACSKDNPVFRLGIDKNTKRYTAEEAELYKTPSGEFIVKPNELKVFNHMFLDIPKGFVDMGKKSIETIMSEYRGAKEVFQRGMEELPLDTLVLVKDLINQGSLLDGATHVHKLEAFIPFKLAYDTLSQSQKDNWCWVTSFKLPYAKFKGELIGTLCTDLAEGMEINKACQTWNKRVDPANYMKVTAPITQRQIEEARKFVEENNYIESFNRRMATIDDIKVSEIKHINSGDGSIKEISMFDAIKPTATRHKRSEFEGVEEVHIDTFLKDILPGCTSVDLFLLGNHDGNLVTLTTPVNPDSKPIFKWDNNYSWTFNGNLAGKSQIKEAVKLAGGNISGVLNCRLAWGDGDGDNSDLDIWASEPSRKNIGYSTSYRKSRATRSPNSGQLDVDNTNPGGRLAVENITWIDPRAMADGKYCLWVNQYRAQNSKGFEAEIEFGGEIYSYKYDRPVSGNVQIAEVTLKDGNMTIKHLLPESGQTSKEVYGLETNKFHKVNLVCLSPNHWGNNKVGNKHFLFMLDSCKATTDLRSFHNENLLPELLEQHRKVMDVLGGKSMIPSTDKQLSGLGFNATVRDEVILRLGGSFKRVIKVKF